MVNGSFDDLSQICHRMYLISSSAAFGQVCCTSGAGLKTSAQGRPDETKRPCTPIIG
ncbi:hypothetical protein ABIB66_006890 [Bradyrhizobium sp. F1.13.3]